MDTKTLSIALIGTGRIGAEPSERMKGMLPDGWLPISHVESIFSIPELQLVGFCDCNEERLSKYSKYYRVNKSYKDYLQMLYELEPDIISIATRTKGRVEIMRKAIELGVKGIYCEKPLAQSLGEALSILDLCCKNNIKLQYGTTRRYMTVYREAKKIVDSGVMGSLMEVVVEYGCEKLLWTHPHFADLLIFFSGTSDIEYIQGNCILNKVENGIVNDDPLVLNSFIKFSNGVFGSIKQSSGRDIVLNFSKGKITIYADGDYIEVRRSDYGTMQVENIYVNPEQSGTQTGFQELAHCVLSDAEPSIRYDEIYAGMVILFGIVESSFIDGAKVYPAKLDKNLIITGKCGNLYA